MPQPLENPGEVIEESDYLNLLSLLNSERNRRGDKSVSINTNDAEEQVEAIDYNALSIGYNSMTGPKIVDTLPIESKVVIIEA
jgi:hypothetical protein